MIKKVFGILKIVVSICFYWLLKVFFSKNKLGKRMEAKYLSSGIVIDCLEKYIIDRINITGELEKTNKVNILLANHNSTIDFAIICGMMYKYNIEDFYFIFKNSIMKVPILGDILKDDINIKRNWDSDKVNIVEQIKKIEKGFIIIYPEGTRFSLKKHKESKIFSVQNKLPIFNYTLCPRVKGSHLIFSLLFELNKLGKIIDMTIIFSKFVNKELYLNKVLTCKELGCLEIIFREIGFDKNDLIYENFKNKIFMIWLQKNILIDKIYQSNK